MKHFTTSSSLKIQSVSLKDGLLKVKAGNVVTHVLR